KNRMKLFYTVLFFLCCSVSFAQTSILKGKVLDSNDAFSLPGATLRLEPGNRYTISDVTGDFEYLSVPAGTYTLSINNIGYQVYTKQDTVNGKIEQMKELIYPLAQTIGKDSVR